MAGLQLKVKRLKEWSDAAEYSSFDLVAGSYCWAIQDSGITIEKPYSICMEFSFMGLW